MKLTVPLVPPSGNVLRRKYRHPHAYRRLRGVWTRTIWGMLPAKSYEKPNGRMMVRIHVEHGRLYDEDNLYSGMKPVLDSLTTLLLIYNDSPEWITLEVTQAKSKEAQTTIEIEAQA